MKKTEARKLVNDTIKPILAEKGYVYKAKWNIHLFENEKVYKHIHLDFDDFYPSQKLILIISLIHKNVEIIYQEIGKKMLEFNNTPTLEKNLNLCYTVVTGSSSLIRNSYQNDFGEFYWINNYNNLKDSIMDESDLADILSTINELIEGEYGNLLLNQFENLKKIDEYLNGNNFWINDYHKPILFGSSGFYLKRLIIAYLVGNPRYQMLFDYHWDVCEPWDNANEFRDGLTVLREYLKGVKANPH